MNDGIADNMAGQLSIAQRLDRLPVTALHLAIFALCAFGLFADIAEVALSNAFSGIFLAAPRRARVIEAELDRARDDIAALIGQRRGSVSIGISPTAECLLLPRALPRFRETYADIPVRMMGGTVSSTIKALREAALDFAVGSASAFTHEPDLRKERLLNSEMTIIARPGHSLSKARALEELKDAEWVINAGVSDPDPATVVMFRPPREPWSPSFAKQRERFAADPNNRERQGAPRPPSILPHSCTGGVPWVWNDSIVFSPHAWPFLRSSSVHTIGFQSGARMRRAPALATSTRLPPGS
jgi:hypothetical protein